MRFLLLLPLLIGGCTPMTTVPEASASVVGADCTLNGHRLYGRVQIVDSFADLKVQLVGSFPDLKVQQVGSFADSCGEWQMVGSSPDLTIELVGSFPDLKVQYVGSFPGIP